MEKISKEEKSIVIGSGIAGLLASRVLSDHFANVVLIEKDHYPENAGPRNGTPQANHVHVLLMKGKQILTDLFPNLERNLLDNGAHKDYETIKINEAIQAHFKNHNRCAL